MNNFRKFKKYHQEIGLVYAIWRGIKYFIFLIKKFSVKSPVNSRYIKPVVCLATLNKREIRLSCYNFGVKIFWNNSEITHGIGLHTVLNTLGLSDDSSKADWQVIEQGSDYFKAKVSYRDLPILEFWDLRIEDSGEICWGIRIETKEDVYIDKHLVCCLLSSRYKAWFCGYEEGNFPRISKWQDISVGSRLSYNLGVKFPTQGNFLPSVLINFKEQEEQEIYPFIQNTSVDINAHLIGIKISRIEDKRFYLGGKRYELLSCRISLFKNDDILDERIEELRQKHVNALLRPAISKQDNIKVLLVNLPWQRDGRWGVRAGSRWPHIKDTSEGNYLPFPFFLAYATSLLKKNGIEAEIIDAIAEKIPENEFIDKIVRLNFDYLVAETSVPSFYEDLMILEKIHQAGISVILCGPNALIYEPRFLEENQSVGYVLCGEYEFSLLELIKTLQENGDLTKVSGLIYRSNNKVFKNPKKPYFDINLLPWPYRDSLPMDKYWDLPGNIPHPSAQMYASRGCPFGCNFCLWPQVLYQGTHYRTRKIEDVVDEMEHLVRQKKFKSVYFDDDTFNIGKERMFEFCREIKRRKLQYIPWAIMARPDLMDEEILKEMKSAGLWAVKYGVESFSQGLVDDCHKNMDISKTSRMIKLTKDIGIKVHLTFCLGLPGETKETIKNTIDYALELSPESVQFSIMTPFPGTGLFEELDKGGRILSYDWSRYDGNYSCIFQPNWLAPQDLENGRRQAYFKWGEYLRRKRGFRGDLRRLNQYVKQNGLSNAIVKTCEYLIFIWLKKNRHINGRY